MRNLVKAKILDLREKGWKETTLRYVYWEQSKKFPYEITEEIPSAVYEEELDKLTDKQLLEELDQHLCYSYR